MASVKEFPAGSDGSMGSSSSSMKTISSSGDGRLVSFVLDGDFVDSCEWDDILRLVMPGENEKVFAMNKNTSDYVSFHLNREKT